MATTETLTESVPLESEKHRAKPALKDLQIHLERLKSKQAAMEHADYSGSAEKLLAFYVKLMPKVANVERCSIFIHDPEKEKVWLKVGTDVDESAIEVPKDDSIVGKTILTGRPQTVYDLDTLSGAHKLTDEATGFKTRNILCVPIRSPFRNEITGAFQLLNKKDGKFSEEDVKFAEELAEHLQLEVDRVFLNQEIFGLTENMYATARKTFMMLVGIFAVAILAILLIFGTWAIVPLFAG